MKYTVDDIKLLHEGLQAKRLILGKYGSYGQFIKQNNLLISEASVDTYVRKKKLESQRFKFVLTQIFDESYDRLILDERQQINIYLKNINKDIVEYDSLEDKRILEKLAGLCEKFGYRNELAKVYWLSGLFYYYREQMTEAVDLFTNAMNISISIKDYNMLFEFYSKLGLLYFNINDSSKAKYYYDKADKLLPKTDSLDKGILALHYYRYGIYYNGIGAYQLAREMFDISKENAIDPFEIGCTLMNIGVSWKREFEYGRALECYKKAIEAFDPTDQKARAIVYNNIAEVYKLSGEYDIALEYVQKSINLLGESISKDKFISVHTLVEINILKGEKKKGIDELLALLSDIEKVYKYTFYKRFIIEGIRTILNYGTSNNDATLLKDLQRILIKLVRNVSHREYQKELKDCLCDIFMYFHEERGEPIEEEIN